jgi:hypothetical protein
MAADDDQLGGSAGQRALQNLGRRETRTLPPLGGARASPPVQCSRAASGYRTTESSTALVGQRVIGFKHQSGGIAIIDAEVDKMDGRLPSNAARYYS